MKKLMGARSAGETRVLLVAAVVLAGLATGGMTTPAGAAPQNMYGLISLTAGAQFGTKAATGSYFRMLQPDGTTYVANGDSRAVDKTYTLLKPGVDGGLHTGTYQGQSDPVFSSTGDGLSSRIIAPEKFLGSKIGLATNQVDPQTGYAVPPPAIAVDGNQVIGNFNSFDLTWNNRHHNQGAPKPVGQQQGLTQDVSGTYNATTRTFAITWRSKIIGGPYNNYTGEWHLAGKFTPNPVVTTDTFLPNGLVGKAYSTTLKATGGKPTYVWSMESGTLPAGLTLSAGGKISGTPIGPSERIFSVRVTDSTQPKKLFATRVLSLKVQPMTVNDQILPTGLAGKAYPSTKLTATGGKATLVWSIAEGALPAGMKISANGTLSGTPTASGLHEFTVQVTDASKPKNIATREFGFAVTPMTVTTTLPRAVVGTSIPSTRMTTNGGTSPFVWTISEWALPPGLKLSSSGVLSGKPTTAGTFSFTVQVADASKPKIIATRTYHYTVEPSAAATSSR